MSALRNNEDPLLKEMLTTSSGEELDPQILDIAKKLAKKMFLKMKEDEAKKKAEEEEARRIVEEGDKGKKKIDYNDDLALYQS
jgi:CHASE3 domain sensor protein